MSDYYILENGEPVAVGDVRDWGRWYEEADRRVALTEISDTRISTVFLGLNHNFLDEGPPVLFETMVFGGRLDGEAERYSTWEQAEAGHAWMVREVRRARALGPVYSFWRWLCYRWWWGW